MVYAFKCVVLVTHIGVVYPLLAGTRIDNVCQEIIGDSVILKLINVLWTKLGTRRKNDISSRARQLARPKMTLNTMRNEDNNLNDILCGKKFDDVIAVNWTA